jgi:hypothetical protein
LPSTLFLDKDNMIYDIDVYIVLGKYTYLMVRNSNDQVWIEKVLVAAALFPPISSIVTPSVAFHRK